MSTGDDPPALHILLAMAPRSYQDVLAMSIVRGCPWARLSVVQPVELDAALDALHPDLVVTSRVTELLLAQAPAWVVLYPEGAGLAIAAVSGVQTTSSDLTMERLLGIIKEAAGRAAPTPTEATPDPEPPLAQMS